MVGKLALLVFVMLLPSLIGGAVLAALRVCRRLTELRRAAAWRRSQPAETVDLLATRLRRLRSDLEATENQPGGTAKHHHVLALRGAYIDTLYSACQRLGVRPPAGGDRARQAEIYRVEADLRERGLDVRSAAVL